MICEHKNFVLTVFKVRGPSLECLNDSYKFLVVSLIPSLCKNHHFREKTIRCHFPNSLDLDESDVPWVM